MLKPAHSWHPPPLAGYFDIFNDGGGLSSRLDRFRSSMSVFDKLTVDNTEPNSSHLRQLK